MPPKAKNQAKRAKRNPKTTKIVVRKQQPMSPNGEHVFSATEYLLDAVAMANKSNTFNTYKFKVGSKCPSMLMKLSAVYGKYKFSNVSVRYVSSSSTATSGLAVVGFAFGKEPNTKQGAMALTPHVSVPVHKSSGWVSINPSLFSWNTTASVEDFIVLAYVQHDLMTNERTVGSVEIRYTISFQGVEP